MCWSSCTATRSACSGRSTSRACWAMRAARSSPPWTSWRPIFLGGILKGNVILVEGAAGEGKTLMGLEFIYRGITEHDEPGIIVVFETSPLKLVRDAAGFGWNLDELQ